MNHHGLSMLYALQVTCVFVFVQLFSDAIFMNPPLLFFRSPFAISYIDNTKKPMLAYK